MSWPEGVLPFESALTGEAARTGDAGARDAGAHEGRSAVEEAGGSAGGRDGVRASGSPAAAPPQARRAKDPTGDQDCVEDLEPATGRRDAPSGLLVIISGPSGVGKDTIIAALQRRGHRPEYHYVVTCTTRGPRPAEVPGVDYNFLSMDEFLALRDAGMFLEANEVHGNWYGTPRADVRAALHRGQHAILKIDVQGAQVVKECVPDALLIFVVPPSLETLFHHLQARRTESADELEIRQRNAALELARQDDYDYVVVNEEGRVDRTAERIEEIITVEERRSERRITV